MPNVPFLPVSYRTLERLMRPLDQFSNYLTALFPLLEYDLERIESEVTAKQYAIGTLASSLFLFLLINLGVDALLLNLRPELFTERNVWITAVFSAVFALSYFAYSIFYPRWKAQQRSALIERDLLFAIRHLTVQTNAGVPLFAAMVSVSEEKGGLGYGMVSREFRRIVKEVEGGADLSEALDNSAARTPSKYYERIMWQLANSSRAGVPVNETLSQLLDYLSDEQRIALRNYGAALSPLALLYLLTTIVGPTLGVIFLMVMSTIVAIPVTEALFIALLLLIAVMQIFFLGLIRSRRPTISL